MLDQQIQLGKILVLIINVLNIIQIMMLMNKTRFKIVLLYMVNWFTVSNYNLYTFD